MNTWARVDRAPLAFTDLDRSEHHRSVVFKCAARVRSRPRSLALAVMIAAACLTSCGNDTDEDSGSAQTTAPSIEVDNPAPPMLDGEKVLIKTRIVGFSGEVLTGSVLGGAAFCQGGTVRHDHGSPDIGFPAINVFDCQAGMLRIGFGPGPAQMDQLVQTSDWRVLDGTGSFAGFTGEGTMRVTFAEGATVRGHETFTGFVVVP
jgi:hypothetical protein